MYQIKNFQICRRQPAQTGRFKSKVTIISQIGPTNYARYSTAKAKYMEETGIPGERGKI